MQQTPGSARERAAKPGCIHRHCCRGKFVNSTVESDCLTSSQARGDGPVAMIKAECSRHRDLRGIARLNPDASIDLAPEENLQTLLGEGVIAITIEPEKGQRYQGLVPMEEDSLSGCLEHYFYQSEQLKKIGRASCRERVEK